MAPNPLPNPRRASVPLLTRGVAAVRGRLVGIHRVWLLNALIAAACAGLIAGPVRGYDAIAHPVIPWWLLAVVVAATERWPVHLEFRRSAHSFSLTDVPLTLALIFCAGTAGVAAIAAGSSLALLFRRLPPIKFVFNLAQFVLAIALGYVIVHVIAGDTPEFGPLVWIGVFVALQVGGLVTITLLSAAMWMTEGSLSREQIRQMFGMDAIVTATNTSLALVLSVILVEEPRAAPLLILPIGIAFFGYRSYISERLRHEKLSFLYEAHRGLSRSREVAQALEGLLERALEAYRSERAEVILFSSEDGQPLRTSIGPGEEREIMAPVEPNETAALQAVLAGHGAPVTVDVARERGEARSYLASRGIQHAMIAQLRGEERAVGLILIANRAGVARRFTSDDLALFETLAANASAALQYDRLEQAVSELRTLQERLHHEAYHDPLTGLANRALFQQEVHGALEAAETRGVAVLFLDLDDFKTFNDTLGHPVGDQLLRAAARRLSGCVRRNDLVARLGGDEFAILCRRATEGAAVEVAERVLRAFELPVSVGSHVLPVRISVGVATRAHSGGRAEDLLRDADVAMYEAKETGKGRYAVFDPEMREVLMHRHGLRRELERAIAKRELVVCFQPIIDIASGETRAMEALVRWRHPTRGVVPPGEFIPLAEETGLIVPIGRFVLEEACRRAHTWGSPGRPLSVQVNLSARELEDERLIDTVTSALRNAEIDPRRLVLEITETLLVRDAEKGSSTLNALRDVGVRLALDDFGTGYSSLSYLRTLPLDVLKIAKPFVDDIASSSADAAFVRLIVELAGAVGVTVIAEGIESAEQLDVLQRLGCDLGQGFLYAEPLDDEAPWVGAQAKRFGRST